MHVQCKFPVVLPRLKELFADLNQNTEPSSNTNKPTFTWNDVPLCIVIVQKIKQISCYLCQPNISLTLRTRAVGVGTSLKIASICMPQAGL